MYVTFGIAQKFPIAYRDKKLDPAEKMLENYKVEFFPEAEVFADIGKGLLPHLMASPISIGPGTLLAHTHLTIPLLVFYTSYGCRPRYHKQRVITGLIQLVVNFNARYFKIGYENVSIFE